MLGMSELIASLATFAIIAIASRRIGLGFARLHLPLITGFLFVGILAGPYVLGMISVESVSKLRFLDEIALGFIAFAAGSEMLISELRGRLRSIKWVTVCLVGFTFVLSVTALVLLSDLVPLLKGRPLPFRLGAALLAASILVARSPSSAIAVVNELRAHGPFTRTALGVTVVMDVIVILVFALNSSIADALFSGRPFAPSLLLLVLGEIAVSIALGAAVGRYLLPLVLSSRLSSIAQASLLLCLGYGIFVGSTLAHDSLHFLFEPLLVCMAASFVLTNFSDHRETLQRCFDDASPLVYTVFFSFAGATLELNVLLTTWAIALILFAVRILGIFLGAFCGGLLAGDPMRFNRVGWMSYVTQAGIGLGLAKEVVHEFPALGVEFGTLIISIIVLNQVVGPPLFKWVLQIVGEAHVQHGKHDLKGTPLALIFGLDSQAMALARQLEAHGWRVRVVSRKAKKRSSEPGGSSEIFPVSELNREELARAGAAEAEAIVCLVDDETSYRICEIAFEHFGTRNLIVQIHDRKNEERFHALKALIVNPETALIGLLDHFVRSPQAASMLTGQDETKDVAEFEIQNPDLHGLALRDLRLPLDVLVLAVQRRGGRLVAHGYTILRKGDRVILMGNPQSLEEVGLRMMSD